MRGERRRQCRERQAIEMNTLQDHSDANMTLIAPILDEAINELGEADRTAIVLRFFEQRDFRAVGEELGSTEDAARMRVSRALEKLESLLKRRGVTTSAAALSTVLLASAVQAAPVGLAVTISTATALAGTTLITTATATVTKAIAMTTLQKTLVSVTIGVLAGAGIYETHQASQLRHRVQTLQQQQAPLVEQIQQLRRAGAESSNQLVLLTEELTRAKNSSAELLKLRGEVGRLRNEANLASDPFVQSTLAWKARAAELKRRLNEMPEQQIPQLQLLGEEDWLDVAKRAKLDTDVGFRRAIAQLRNVARGHFAGKMSVALMQYTRANGGRLPDDILQLKPYFKSTVDDAILQQYQLLYTGKVSDVPPGQWLITEKSPLRHGFDSTFRVGYDAYGVEHGGPFEDALGRFYEANGGREPTQLSQLLSYVQDPAEKAALEKLVQGLPAR
jgi:hypothetical protein